MNTLRRVVFCVVVFPLAWAAAAAAEQPASAESIREMLRVTESEKLVAGMMPQMEAMMGQMIQKSLAEVPMGPDERVLASELSEKVVAKMNTLIREEMSWSKLEPLYLRIYQKAFTQEEIDGMLAFYKTPAGKALIKKMPLVVQETMTATQQMWEPMMKKIMAATQETVEELKARLARTRQ